MPITRRGFLKAVGLTATAVAAPRGALATGGKRRNFVLIMADDVSPDWYGCYKEHVRFPNAVRTPHIDRMAREGVLFVTAWATPMCSPTRAMIMTGRYANRTGFYHNALKLTERPDLVRDNLTFGKLLKQAGYATAIAGKWHVTGDEPQSQHGGFEEYSLWSGPKELAGTPGSPKHTGAWEDDSTPSRYWHPCIIRNGQYLPTKPEDFGPEIHTDFLCDFIRRKRLGPFLAYFAMSAPHGTREGSTTTPLYGRRGEMGRAEEAKERTARFRALNEYIDVCVGRILGTLEKEGLLDDTVVMFTSDNGTAVTAKTRAVERGASVPFVVFGGGVKRRGATTELTDLTDVLPTMLDFAQVKLPEGYEIDGRSLAPFLEGRTDTHREWIHSYIGTSQMLRDKRWLLEAVNAILGSPRGRFYDCGTDRTGKGYRDVTESKDPAALAARQRFDEVLKHFPPIRKDDPFWKTKIGARFLKAYTEPEAARKHLHNHRDYEYGK